MLKVIYNNSRTLHFISQTIFLQVNLFGKQNTQRIEIVLVLVKIVQVKLFFGMLDILVLTVLELLMKCSHCNCVRPIFATKKKTQTFKMNFTVDIKY